MSTSPSQTSDFSHGSLFQNSVYVGIIIENILYGVVLVLYFRTMVILLGNRGEHKKFSLFYALFSSMMVFSITVWVATQALFGEKMWLLDSDFPGGPDAYWDAYIWIWYMDWATTGIIVLQLMTDALMIYRCRIIWDGCRAIVIPIILWLFTFVLGGLVAWTSSVPGSDFFTGIAAQFSLAYWTVSVFLNTILTCMICYRIVLHGRKVREHLGHEHASLYFGVVTLVVESVLPYTLSGVAFLASLGSGSSTAATFICVYFMMMMLILRVLAGRAWDSDTSRRPGSTLKFSPDDASGSQWSDPGSTRADLQTLPNV
ncbi:hypothetical protein HD554DRAFT_2040516 [Boletus coccyginus]|nr:hypothetical protein HD554DRAFT_2040516 [Boletus coccyginus]